MKAFIATLLLCGPVLAQTTQPAATPGAQSSAADPAAAAVATPSRSPEQILTAMRAVPQPQIDPARVNDPAYAPTLKAEVQKYRAGMAPLRDELLQNFPDHALAGQFLQSWVMEKAGDDRDFGKAKEAAAAYAKAHPNTAAGKAATALKAQVTLMQPKLTFAEGRQAIDDAIAVLGKSEEFDELEVELIANASDFSADQRIDAYKKLAAGNPSNVESINARIKLASAVGKPFDLAFKDVTSGKDVSIKDLKGKVVVIDFWATWCGPCVADLPETQEIYERLKPKGFEIIGVSLDAPESEGGKEALTKFIAERKVTWPIYYQGNGWDSEFSKSWGVSSIPRYFIVDQNGNLYNTDARGKIAEIAEKLMSEGAPKS